MSSRTASTISPTKPSPPKVLTRPSKLSRTPPTKGTPEPNTTPAATPNATQETMIPVKDPMMSLILFKAFIFHPFFS